MYKAFKLQPHPCTLYNNKNMIIQENLLFSKPEIVLNISFNEWFKSIPIEIILKKMLKDHLSKINVIDCVLTLEPYIYIFIKVKRWKLAIKWCKFYFDIIFFIKKSYKNNYTVHENTFDWGRCKPTHSVKALTWSQKTAHFPQNRLKKLPPTYEFPITKYLMELIPYLLIFIHTSCNIYYIQLYEASKNNYIYQIL